MLTHWPVWGWVLLRWNQYTKSDEDHKATDPYQRQPLAPTSHKPYLLVNFFKKRIVF